jgi:hypothetical protein
MNRKLVLIPMLIDGSSSSIHWVNLCGRGEPVTIEAVALPAVA